MKNELMDFLPVVSSLLFAKETVSENEVIKIPAFCVQAQREYYDRVVAFMLRYYYIDSGNSDYSDALNALRVTGNNLSEQKLLIPQLKKIQGFDLTSVQNACNIIDTLLARTYSRREGTAPLVYHTLSNAFQSIARLSDNQPIYGFIECDYGLSVGLPAFEYATKSFFTNGTLIHVVCAKKGLSAIDIRLLMLHYALATESRLSHAGTDQMTTKTGAHYITHIAIVLATGQTVWKARTADIPFAYIDDYKAKLLKYYQTELRGRL